MEAIWHGCCLSLPGNTIAGKPTGPGAPSAAGLQFDPLQSQTLRIQSLRSEWERYGMDAVYPSPETLLQVSQRAMARHRLLGFNLIRSNPKLCGFNLTGMLDHGMTGEGVWRFWRDWKPGAFDEIGRASCRER